MMDGEERRTHIYIHIHTYIQYDTWHVSDTNVIEKKYFIDTINHHPHLFLRPRRTSSGGWISNRESGDTLSLHRII